MKWIKVMDELPEFGVDVLVYMAGTKNVYSDAKIDYSKFSNYEPKVMTMQLFKSRSASAKSYNGIYWNYEQKGNQIHHRPLSPAYNLITHWMPLPQPPKE